MERLATVVALLALCGCASVPPPAQPPPALSATPTRTIHVVTDEAHTGLIVRAADVPAAAWPARRDFPGAEYLELGWGEREYYIREDMTLWLGLRALFWSDKSTIHVVAFSGPIEREFPGAQVLEFRVPEAGFARLVAFVAESHERDAAGRPIALAPGQRPHSRFYASARRFSFRETCNTWIARALREAGVDVDPGRAVTAAGLMRQLRQAAAQRAAISR